MTSNLRNKLEALGASYASPRQTLDIARTPSFPALPAILILPLAPQQT